MVTEQGVKKSCALEADEMASSEKVPPMHDKKEKHCFQRKTTSEQADGMPSLSRFTCSFKCMEFGAFTDLMSRLYLLAVGSLCCLPARLGTRLYVQRGGMHMRMAGSFSQ
ncbi:hypothetical protein C4D60_Mb03t06160 [Musa balbisiana]|uniref:Uncharacterized protein n=1 Tax=Musa balbisiana TaxID=52838 RepID=A0A4S8J7Y3_MUSBA|nr:hypothetical protein C4D60_Mb03t06160 [Musa balbisiana]